MTLATLFEPLSFVPLVVASRLRRRGNRALAFPSCSLVFRRVSSASAAAESLFFASPKKGNSSPAEGIETPRVIRLKRGKARIVLAKTQPSASPARHPNPSPERGEGLESRRY